MGIDLAWSTRARTGVAVVDERGTLLDSVSLRSDAEIVDWLHREGWAPVTIAVDAPLIVTNVSGQRPCERMISSAFGRYGASCHASNRAMSYLDPPRGAALAQQLGWETDPTRLGTRERPACIEVYPHPAMVSLFQLATVLPYKAKAGRTPQSRRSAFVQLLDHMERLPNLDLGACTRWSRIRSAVEGATRHVELEIIEDELDAIFCAHLAWLWNHDRPSLRVWGDGDTGYIVAPSAPTATTPNPAMLEVPDTGPESITSVAFEVEGRPATFATAAEAAWRAAVEQAAGEAMEGRFPLGPATRVAVEVHFRLGRGRTANERWDLDNLLKPTIDALSPVLGRRRMAGNPQVDDERVDEIHATKRVAADGERPGATIRVRVL